MTAIARYATMTIRKPESKSHFLDNITVLIDREDVATGIFLLPALILLGLFLVFPILYLGYLSFTGGSFTPAREYIGWG